MKRFLSLVLTVVMLHSTFSCLTFTVSAAGDVESISYHLAKPLEFIEGCGEIDYWYGEYEDEEAQEWSHYEYCGQDGDILTVNYTDGSSVDYVYDFYDYEDSEGNEISSWDLWDSDQEFNNQWTAGNSYEFRLSYMGKQTTVPVTIIENPIEAIYFEPDLASVVAISENEFNSEWFWSNINEQIVPRGSVFVVEYKNGEKVEFEAAYYEDSWSSGNGDGFYIVCCNEDDESWVECWAPHYDPDYETIAFGEEYELTFRYMGKKFNHTISFADYEASLESIEFTPAKPYEFIENTGGCFEDWLNPDTEEWETKYFYDEYRIDDEGNILTVNFTDGRSVDYIRTEYDGWKSSDGEYLYDSPDCYDYQSINPWTIDGENYFVVKYMNKEVQVPVSVVENPVESISYTPAGTTNWIENDEEYGYYDYYDYYDPETHNGYSCDWFRYEYYKTEGDILTVNNKDGSTVEYIYDGWSYISSDGSEISKKEVKISDNQSYHNQWTVGNSYDFNVSYVGFTTTFSVNIIENPVESISYTINKPIEIFEYSNGYWDEDEETYYYKPTLSDYIEKITLNYNDGTTEDFIWDEGEWEYCNSDGEYLDYSLQATQGDEPWELGGDNSFKIIVYGKEAEIPVTIIENPVESVSYTMSHPIEIIENTNGYWDEREYYDEENDEWVYEDYYSYNFEHISSYIEKFTLNYTDGTTEDFIWDEDEGQYCNADGEYLEYSQEIRQWKDPWVIGGDNNFKIIVYGKEADIPVTILENPVTSISYTLSQPIELIENANGCWDERWYYDENEDYIYEEYFYYYTKDISEYIEKFTVNYTDGTTEDFIWDEDEQKYCSSIGQYLDYSTYENQWNNPWKKGENNNLKVVAFGKEMYVPITFVEYDVASISYTPISPVKLIEGLDVYREPWDEIDRYRTDKYTICNEGDILTITFSDGSVKEYVCHLPDRYDSDGYGVHFFDSEGNELPFGNVSSNFYFFGMDEYVNQWTVGNEYEVICCYMGVNTTIPVKIVENPVESISYTPNSFDLIENNDGYWTQEYVWIGDEPEMKEYYKYNFDISNGETLTVNYTDGSSINYIYDSYSEDFVAPDGRRILTYYVNRKSYRALAIESNQSYENQWIAGNSYEFIVSYMGRETTIPVTVSVCDHIWVKGEGLINSPPSCTEPGWDGEFCEKCESIREFEIPATGHTEVKDKAVEATCTETGLTEGSHCSVCDAVIVAQNTVPATGHTASEWIIDKDSTCTEEGSQYKECTVCKTVVETQVIDKKDHNESGWKTEKKATVNSEGKKYKECTECGKILKTASISQLKCSKPKLKSIENTEYGVKITWGKVSGADSYAVYRKTGSGKYKKIGTTSKTYYTDKKASSGKKYYYIVKAVNEAGSSSSSSSLSKLYLADPTLKTPSSTKKGIVLKWNKITGADGYVVYRKTGSGSYKKIATVKGSTKVTYTDKSAKKGKKYTYKIKAYKSKTYSAYSNAKTIKDKY